MDQKLITACADILRVDRMDVIAEINDGRMETILDEQVHDAKLAEAANINNGGIYAQVDYLTQQDSLSLYKKALELCAHHIEDGGDTASFYACREAWRVAFASE